MKLTAALLLLRHNSYFRLHQERFFEFLFRGRSLSFIHQSKIWESILKIHPEIADYLEKNRDLLKQSEELIHHWREKMGIITITPFDNFYPSSFFRMKDPPWILFYRGTPVWQELSFLSVVGSREITHETTLWMEMQLTEFLKQSGAGLASGGARGVDMKAHQLCLRSLRPTIAFLPSGLSKIYPSDFEKTANLILEQGGALISEYEPFVEMQKSFFKARNRLIASLGVMTLITQAHRRSGTMLTAQHAIDNSKTLAVVPAHPQQVHYSGNLKLLSEGAFLLCDAQELTNIFLCESAHSFQLPLQVGLAIEATSIPSETFENDIHS